MKTKFFSKYFGTKEFYKRILILMIPIMIQNGITNFVNMLDNIMVGQIGTAQMTGVAITNQLITVYNLCIFGAVSGAGIFGAQFFGKKDYVGMRNTFRFKIISTTLLTALVIGIFSVFGKGLINLYLQGEGNPEDAALSLGYARQYMLIMFAGLVPYAIVQSYSSTLRESGEATVPMVVSLIAVFVNLLLNYILIFGHFGAPALGISGAAIATVVSRFAELGCIVFWSAKNKEKTVFLEDAFVSISVPKKLSVEIIKKGLPLTLNETLWAAGMAMLSQCYSVRGLDVVAANNIAQTFWNVISVSIFSLGAAVGIILGQMLGAGDTEGARRDSIKHIVFSALISILVGVLFCLFSGIIPQAYKTSDNIKYMAKIMICIFGVTIPLDAVANVTYFILRSGGKSLVTFLFDSCFVWVVSVPVAFVLSHYTDVNIFVLFFISQLLPLIKDIIGIVLVKKGVWIKNIVSD